MPRQRRMPSGEQDAALGAHLALLKRIARDHLERALMGIARDVDAARSPTTPFDSYYADERKAIEQAFDESFREIWGEARGGGSARRDPARFVTEDAWLYRMDEFMAQPPGMGTDKAAEVLAAELAQETEAPPTAGSLAQLYRRRRPAD